MSRKIIKTKSTQLSAFFCILHVMKNFYVRLLAFLFLNFGALAIGGLFTNSGVNSNWYLNANQAPWTPPGWVFGAAWTFIMILLSFFMTNLTNTISFINFKNRIIQLYWIQLFLNIIWNPIFFYWHLPIVGLVVISILTLVVFTLFFKSKTQLNLGFRLLILPYMIWLLIATSLNAYIAFMN